MKTTSKTKQAAAMSTKITTHSGKSKAGAAKPKAAKPAMPMGGSSAINARAYPTEPAQLEVLIEEFWRRNVQARARLGMRPHQDVLTAERPKGMSSTHYAALLEEADRATLGFIEGLATMWGHSVVERSRPYGVGIFGHQIDKTRTAKTASKKTQSKRADAHS